MTIEDEMPIKLFQCLFISICLTANAGINDFDPQSTPGLTSPQIQQGWLSLFDGKSFFGWRVPTTEQWEVKEGTLIANEGEIEIIRTACQFDDFELSLEYRCHRDTNSGVFIRSSPFPKNPKTDCFEINIAPQSSPFPTGSIVGHIKADSVAIHDDWNRMRIVADGSNISVWINGQKANQWVAEGRYPKKGYIGLQHNSGQIRFRNIAVRPLHLGPLWSEQGLSSWTTKSKMQSEFQLSQRGILSVKGGRGQIETKQTYRDFVFTSHIRTNQSGLNSGVFFRCIPGDLMNGYESQIQNEVVNDNPTQPRDCGTGGIFRRFNARYVNSKDEAWFSKTIIADGATIGIWVNGLQVTDWTDQRKPHPNPRKGRRLDAGTIIFQGHDPTTDLSFKNAQIRELSTRN
ncbi:MAG: DUF1080 domain-containing protein [Planctomycetota bacterium]